MPAGNCIEPWLSHLRFGELEGRRRDDLGGGFRRGCFCSAFSRWPADDLGGLSWGIGGAAARGIGTALERTGHPNQQILDSVVVDDAVGGVAHDIEVERAGRLATRRCRGTPSRR